MATVVVLLYMTAWVAAINQTILEQREMAEAARQAGVKAPPVAVNAPTQQIASSILDAHAPSVAFISDAMMTFVDPLRGASGKVRLATREPGGSIVTGAPEGAAAVLKTGEQTSTSPEFAAPEKPGLYKLAVQINEATREVQDLNVATLVPFSEKRGGRIGPYFLGNWPFEHAKATLKANYGAPAGFIEVTPENANTQVSDHFRLRDFLTKDQPNVWPKYILLSPKLLDKLELTIGELEAMGHPVRRVTVMSGFRTPNYNVHGGNTAGRANLSRHMYGDASDIFIDNDGNGSMDDLNHDGRVDARDAEVVLAAAERVERNNPSLVGGVGVYSASAGHGPFTHIDVRGYRARWRGVGGG